MRHTDDSGSSAQTLRLREPGDLLEVVPYLVGFHPQRSLVLLGLDRDQVAVTVRIDLSDVVEGEAVSASMAILRRARAGAVILVVYLDSDDAERNDEPADVGSSLPGQSVIAGATETLRAAGLQVIESLLVRDGRWWSYDGYASGCCCCVAGDELPGPASSGAASAVFAGMVARPSREALQALLEPEPELDRARLTPGIWAHEDARLQETLDGGPVREQRSIKRALFAAARASDEALLTRESLAIPDPTLCRYAAGLADVAVRDPLWLGLDQGRIDGRGLWRVLLRSLPSPYDCTPLFLFGWATWREGNGALAAMAAERALESDPSYSAADLLLGAIQGGLDPFRTPRLRATGRSTGPTDRAAIPTAPPSSALPARGARSHR
jgi:hypothetical protein